MGFNSGFKGLNTTLVFVRDAVLRVILGLDSTMQWEKLWYWMYDCFYETWVQSTLLCWLRVAL